MKNISSNASAIYVYHEYDEVFHIHYVISMPESELSSGGAAYNIDANSNHQSSGDLLDFSLLPEECHLHNPTRRKRRNTQNEGISDA